MARIPDEIIAEVRERIDIVALVGEKVELKKVGRSFKGLCPFHHEKTPSFHVLPDKRFFHCFGCQKNGDPFRFIMELEGKTFVEAVRECAGRVGITIPERETTPAEQARLDARSRFYEVNAVAAAFYREVLASEAGATGRSYLKKRGIGSEIADVFQLGMAPEAWDGLARRLHARHISPDLPETLGLIAPRRTGGSYDRFRNRLMCPVILPAGEVVAFSGRTLGDDPAKYINSPGSPIYTKGHVLFGLHAARTAFRARERAILVEGNFDVIALHQAGFAETVAPLGTALTDRHVHSLRLLVPRVILCLDGDRAGRAAILRDIMTLLEAGVETRVAALPDGEDPDSFVRKNGPAAMDALISKAQPAVEYFIYEAWARSDSSSADQRSVAIKEAAPVIAKIGDDTKREILIGELATALGVERQILSRAVIRARAGSLHGDEGHSPRSRGEGLPVRVKSASPAAPPPQELKILVLLADHPNLMADAEAADARSLLTDERLRDMYSAALMGQSLVQAAPPELRELVAREVLNGSYMSLQDPHRTLAEMLRALHRERLQAEGDALGLRIKEAERRGDVALARELAMRRLQTRNLADDLRRRPKEEPR
ncbi:MAG: DNA primase [Deltaproteobacteria bacterium]|nr:DNA primase [Deltaproteobacteria bacterium]